MLYPNPPNERNKGLSVWLDRHSSAANANRVIAGKGVRIKNTTKGTIVEAIPGARNRASFHPFKVYRAVARDADDRAKPWRYWSVRGGFVSSRDRYGIGTSGANGENLFQTIGHGTDGVVRGILNGQWDYYTNSTEPNPSSRDDGEPEIDITVEDVAVGNSGDFTVSNSNKAARFVLDSTPDALGLVAAGFWLEGRDSTGSHAGKIDEWVVKCRMFSLNPGGTGRVNEPWPDNAPNIIPIAQLSPPGGLSGSPATSLTLEVSYQGLDHHLIYRYPPGPGWDAVGVDFMAGGRGPGFFRGIWDAGDSMGLAGQFFYDGDCVSVPVDAFALTTVGGDTVTIPASSKSYVHVGNGNEAAAPPTGAWLLVAGFSP